MLGWLRSRTRNIFIYAIFGIIILAFTFSLGGGGGLSGTGNPNNIAAVYGQVIDRRTYGNALSDQEAQFRRLLGDQWTDQKSRELGLPLKVLIELENQMLLRHAAEEMGLGITDTELRDAVVSLPGFNTNGQFDYDRYKRALALQRRTPKQFEESIRQDLLSRKMEEFLLDSVHVSKTEMLEAFRKEREKVDLEFVAFDLKRYEDTIRPNNDALAEFREKQSARISDYYNSHLSEYQRPEQVRAAHLLISLGQDASAEEEAEAETKARRLAGEARQAGADFGKLAKEHSGDSVTAARGGDLGWFSPGQMVKAFDEAVFGAKPGTIVAPVKTRFGFHVIKVEEKRSAIEKTLADVEEEIARKLFIEEQAQALAQADAQEIIEKGATAKDLASLALPRAARHGTTGPFTRGVPKIPNLGRSKEAIRVGFRLSPDSPLSPEAIAVEDSLVVLRLKAKIQAPGNPPAQDLDPFKQRLLSDKRRKTIVLWYQSARTEAETAGEIERNERLLSDLVGVGS